MKIYHKTRNVAHRIIEGQAFLINTKTSTLHELDETGTFIWKLAEKGKDSREIANALSLRYEVPSEQALKDTEEFLKDLENKGILE